LVEGKVFLTLDTLATNSLAESLVVNMIANTQAKNWCSYFMSTVRSSSITY